MNERPTYILKIKAEPGRGVGDVHGLRALLKTLLRRYGFRALTISQQLDSDGRHENKV